MTKDSAWKKAERLTDKKAFLTVKARANDKMADWYDKDPEFRTKVDTIIRDNRAHRTGQVASQFIFGIPGQVVYSLIKAPIMISDPNRKDITNKAREAFNESAKEVGRNISEKKREKYANSAGYDFRR